MVQPPTEKLSIYLFPLASYDSKKIVDKDIRREQAQVTESQTHWFLLVPEESSQGFLSPR